MANIGVKGLKELDAALAELPQKLARKAVVDSLAAGARIVAKDAKRRIPRDTGLTQKQIVVRRRRNVARVAGKGFRTVGLSTVIVGVVGDRGHIAQFIEKGTSRMPARPFLRPALDSQAPAALNTFKERLRVAIEKEVGKGRR